jgi:hypothetical protein
MKIALVALTLTLTAGAGFAGQRSRTFTGVISDSMCLRDHAAMKVSPISKCVNDCVKASKDIRYSLIAGKNAYTLRDREKPARFAGQTVKVTGVLRGKTNVIDVESIEPVR